MWDGWGGLRPNLDIPEKSYAGVVGGLIELVCTILAVQWTPLRHAMSDGGRPEDVP